LWATSSNLPLALQVMDAWGFDFSTSAVWDKYEGGTGGGTGFVFQNQHEVLLYGTRGNMPAPAITPQSIFRYPRGEYAAKPPEIRATIERMYPHFGPAQRLELFARGFIEGWQTYGFEARHAADPIDAEVLASVIGQVPRVHTENDAAEPPTDSTKVA
jgi:N6-adenosine-specific RNA methylase IME4